MSRASRAWDHMARALARFGASILFMGAHDGMHRAQSAPPAWQTAASGKLSFEIASVKQNLSSKSGSDSNVPLFGERYPPNGGLFSAVNQPLSNYLAFAYNLDITRARMLDSELPKWAIADRFDIQARAPAGATKDQMRLMMQSLLADRFHLKAHLETRETKIYALELIKPGLTGPRLQPHAENPPCADTSSPLSSSNGSVISTPEGFPMRCNSPIGFVDSKGAGYGGRKVTMQMFAQDIIIAPGSPAMDRPVFDQTGLTGKYDFIMKYSPQWNATAPAPNDTGPTFLEALQDQLGLRLESTKAAVDVLVVEHVEQPSPN